LLLLFVVTALADIPNNLDRTVTNDKISAALSSEIAEASSSEKFPVIIMLKNQSYSFYKTEGRTKIDSEQKYIMNFLNSSQYNNKVQKIKSIHIINAIAANVTPDIVSFLVNRSEVWTIEPDEKVSIVDSQTFPLSAVRESSTIQSDAWGVDKIEAPAVWQKGITGKGVTVALVDTGIDATHPDLAYLPNTKNPKVLSWTDYVNGETSPYDDNGHGTHVAGTISGTGANGINTGVAPGTNLIVAKVFDSSGSGYDSNVILAFEWAITNGAKVINFSGGGPDDSAFGTTIDNTIASGVIPVVAAGNSGPSSSTILCPGDEINSTTVGATDSSDNIASFSSRGPIILNEQSYIKPDVTAPGVSITSTYPGGGYEVLSGTSMATPHVSGTISLMLQNNHNLKPSSIKDILESTAVDLGTPGRDNTYGSGRINAYNAVFYNPVTPIANFTCNVTQGYMPLTVQFNDCSQNATGWNWDFGDGANSTQQNTTHVYSAVGNFTVNLTVSNANGIGMKSTIINVTLPPFPGYTNPPTDPNHDGFYEDINGNGQLDFDDVVAYYDNMDWITQNNLTKYFDYNRNNQIDFDDVVKLYDIL
jgi:serine protease AprX